MNILDLIYGYPKNKCPRCGGKQSAFPALSRRIDADICNHCRMDEFLKDMRNEYDPIRNWRCCYEQ